MLFRLSDLFLSYVGVTKREEGDKEWRTENTYIDGERSEREEEERERDRK